MGTPQFPIPATVPETLSLLNASGTWNISLFERDDRTDVATGDQLVFSASTQQEVEAFLAGCFIATYDGASLDAIMRDLAERGMAGQDQG
ncbi:MAG: hypothetical protein IT340_01810 [Chloroflexi bacterium]|nr:hypothetical protein [Chloroflexota bacterium]